MMNLPQVVESLKQAKNLSAVSREVEIHGQLLWKIKDGRNTNPTYETLKKLSDYFETHDHMGRPLV